MWKSSEMYKKGVWGENPRHQHHTQMFKIRNCLNFLYKILESVYVHESNNY